MIRKINSKLILVMSRREMQVGGRGSPIKAKFTYLLNFIS